MSAVGPEPVLTPEQHKELRRWMTPVIEGEVVGPRPMSAPTPPQIAPPAQGGPTTPARPSGTATDGTRLLPRRDVTSGRFAPPLTFPRCERCGWTLAESLAGGLYCCDTGCTAYRKHVGVVAGVDPGTVTAAAIEPPT